MGEVLGDYSPKTYGEMITNADQLGSGVLHNSLAPTISDYKNLKLKMISVFSPNSTKWYTLDIACMLHKIVIVPMYNTLGSESTKQILVETGITTMFLVSAHID